MIDQLHILTLAWVLVAAAITALLWRWTADGVAPARVARTNLWSAVAGSLLYVAVATALIANAAVRH
ncbi:hypothetical protein [Kitasatospora sp. NBC_00315]|uniref:hypothetical protein n=1 Tax=Kitasatospora sp. NBC_00315 TaxID=2975963 RepID=UPI0032557B42